MRHWFRWSILATLLVARSVIAADQRSFTFTSCCEVTAVPPGAIVRLWVPVPSTGIDQDIEVVSTAVPAGVSRPVLNRDEKYGNRMAYLSAPAPADGSVKLATAYHVTRREAGDRIEAASPVDYLSADRTVPVGGRAMTLLAGKSLPADPVDKARVLYDLVDDRMTYRKDKPGWGTGDADWACDSRFGNCTDFHSLFMALARGNKIPARFEIGFEIPPAPAGTVKGYHCWAWFSPSDRRWIPVDISHASQHPDQRQHDFGHLSPDRVAFSVGRDIVLNPKPTAGPVNFFVYPYAEVDGKALDADRIKQSFSYRNDVSK